MSLNRDSAAEQYLYLTTTGRTSGLPRLIEIWFVTDGERYYLLSSGFRGSQWVKNIEKEPSVQVRVGSREFVALGRVLDPVADHERWDLAQRLGREKYGWGDGLPVELTPI